MGALMGAWGALGSIVMGTGKAKAQACMHRVFVLSQGPPPPSPNLNPFSSPSPPPWRS